MPPVGYFNDDIDDFDRGVLAERGIDLAAARAEGLRTEGGSLFIPYRDLDGRVNCFARRRPHDPRGGPKYLQPKGTPLRAYFPVGSLDKLGDGCSPVYVTEGELKAIALSQLGLAAVGIGGVWCGCKPGTGGLIDDLAAIPWTGRPVYVVFDYDAKAITRQEVGIARRRLAQALRAAGAGEVFAVELPPGPDGGKQGVDDYLVGNGSDAFAELVRQAIPVIEIFPAAARGSGGFQ